MGKRKSAEQPWEQKAEALIRHVEVLLSDPNRKAIKKALANKHGQDRAEALLDQLASLTHALELELLRVPDPANREKLGLIGKVILGALGVIGVNALNHVTDDIYDKITGATSVAQDVVDACNGDITIHDERPVRGSVSQGLPSLGSRATGNVSLSGTVAATSTSRGTLDTRDSADVALTDESNSSSRDEPSVAVPWSDPALVNTDLKAESQHAQVHLTPAELELKAMPVNPQPTTPPEDSDD